MAASWSSNVNDDFASLSLHHSLYSISNTISDTHSSLESLPVGLEPNHSNHSLPSDRAQCFVSLDGALYRPFDGCNPLHNSSQKLFVPRLSANQPIPLRSLTLKSNIDNPGYPNDDMFAELTPESPPELSSSRSSTKSSSQRSSRHSQDEFNNDTSHFEDISLVEDSTPPPVRTSSKRPLRPRPLLRAAQPSAAAPLPRKTPPSIAQRKGSDGLRTTASLNSHARSMNSAGRPVPGPWKENSPLFRPSLAVPERRSNRRQPSQPMRSVPPLTYRKSSPQLRSDDTPIFPARSGSLPQRRKSAHELEQEYDSDEDLPEEAVVWNVPLSPRPRDKRPESTSPDRSPASREPPSPARMRTTRTKSWNDAMLDLSREAKKLTAKLEEHADEVGLQDPPIRTSSLSPILSGPFALRRSQTFDLPPVQRSNIMVDPLPISKEKEKHLTRTRPSWLPPKCPKEEARHLREYQRIMESYMESEKRKSQTELKARAAAAKAAADLTQHWETSILPDFSAAIAIPTTRELWWRGVPASLRGRVWPLAIGNELKISPESFAAASTRFDSLPFHEQAPLLDKINADIYFAFPSLSVFQPGQPYYNELLEVCKAYVAYRSDAGPVRGTAAVAALLLMHMRQPELQSTAQSDVFTALANLLNRPDLPLLAFFLDDEAAKQRVYRHVRRAMSYKLPRLLGHFDQLKPMKEDDWLRPMVQSLFTMSPTQGLSLEEMCRLWDICLFEGDMGVVRAVVGVLSGLEGRLYGDKADVLAALGWPSSPSSSSMATARRASGSDGAQSARSSTDTLQRPGGPDALIADVRWAGREDPPVDPADPVAGVEAQTPKASRVVEVADPSSAVEPDKDRKTRPKTASVAVSVR